MARLSEKKYAPFYDLFKLIVAVILVIILILLLLRDRQELPTHPLATLTQPTAMATSTPLPPTTTETAIPATSTPETQPAATSAAATPNPLPTSTPDVLPALTESIPTSDPNACPSAPTHIQSGNKVRVLHWLYLRTHPGLNSQIILTNKPGATMDVIGGPVCTLKNTTESSGAYLWWNVRTENGREGWSAEAPLILPYYFMESIR
jgi:hypothetical protein